jgi:O-antigen/teichoic acid export membrane protein
MRERTAVRFGATFLVNIARTGLSFLSGVVVARGLGASGYGDLTFLMGSFAAISHLLEMGTSSAFYTFISQRPRSRMFLALYAGWMAAQFAVTALAVGVLLPPGMLERLWLGHARGSILLACAASFLMTQAWPTVSQLGEARRRTVLVQTAALLQTAAHLVLIALAAVWQRLSVSAVLWILAAEYAVLIAGFGPALLRANLSPSSEEREEPRRVLASFASYCRPLIVYGWVGCLYMFADGWLLQRYGGAEQQGFFAIGRQFANISLIATTSMLRPAETCRPGRR